jgi:hypothetical protein
MSKTLGQVTFADGRERFFVHDSTVGYSYWPLFTTAEAAWIAYDTYGPAFWERYQDQGLVNDMSPAAAVRLAYAYGRTISGEEDVLRRDEGLATDRMLIEPINASDEPPVLLVLDGLVHRSYMGDLGFAGRDLVFSCDHTYHEESVILPLADAFRQAIKWCSRCAATMSQ